ncbi:MAG: hypothetical protein COW11_04595 [Candidatus Omnitrophica bacterium CG12_big_fil_rev_8_21_14_0_65_43_15]|uniref:PilZ domain-containing protein n=1 Tax=Candidatus Taenaricola geysiri TaxID=1974752 RepID=A0A2J0LQN0_9BACT|nr:MAG: hypothetical protein AUJ89_04540 [Candidatus Omnitrophica bacterium CG1_02_43_210]PIR65683.1 MAG: hypothetical protein COU52_02970 [Candidatus Omnitrophica bacterium CG10_big_fil_rev_8_21_14_0_10_43_8]PIV12488.1 MAG: hypothetical protein COS48_00175 [Candidatus Omnitrophica bacterium CG03_land_8_20_14_0_80_43_22]PIW66147.1 MAG: hypothetical protein COW11_04595 [Candidatus Omnitrophica bacterium CG12_big_fil_rev_8_21_14_0_65_43_15]PIW80500.1 MAG: hypothetical protein COZ98_01945 [Candida
MPEQANPNIARRRFPRVHLRAFAQITSDARHDIDKEFNAECINISEGGCCLEIGDLLSGQDIDFGVKVSIEFPDGDPHFVTTGKIAWLKEEDVEIVTKYLVGIEFNRLTKEQISRIKKYAQSQLEAR